MDFSSATRDRGGQRQWTAWEITVSNSRWLNAMKRNGTHDRRTSVNNILKMASKCCVMPKHGTPSNLYAWTWTSCRFLQLHCEHKKKIMYNLADERIRWTNNIIIMRGQIMYKPRERITVLTGSLLVTLIYSFPSLPIYLNINWIRPKRIFSSSNYLMKRLNQMVRTFSFHLKYSLE